MRLSFLAASLLFLSLSCAPQSGDSCLSDTDCGIGFSCERIDNAEGVPQAQGACLCLDEAECGVDRAGFTTDFCANELSADEENTCNQGSTLCANAPSEALFAECLAAIQDCQAGDNFQACGTQVQNCLNSTSSVDDFRLCNQ